MEFKTFRECPCCGKEFDVMCKPEYYITIDITFECPICGFKRFIFGFEAEKSIAPKDFKILEEGER